MKNDKILSDFPIAIGKTVSFCGLIKETRPQKIECRAGQMVLKKQKCSAP